VVLKEVREAAEKTKNCGHPLPRNGEFSGCDLGRTVNLISGDTAFLLSSINLFPNNRSFIIIQELPAVSTAVPGIDVTCDVKGQE
jgi:hypothetical protein